MLRAVLLHCGVMGSLIWVLLLLLFSFLLISSLVLLSARPMGPQYPQCIYREMERRSVSGAIWIGGFGVCLLPMAQITSVEGKARVDTGISMLMTRFHDSLCTMVAPLTYTQVCRGCICKCYIAGFSLCLCSLEERREPALRLSRAGQSLPIGICVSQDSGVLE